MQKLKKRILNKKVQKIYYEKHEFDEYMYHVYGVNFPRDQIHEILHGSRKTYEDWNMIALTSKNHGAAHSGKISKRELFQAKILSGVILPEEIIREFDLKEYL